MNLTLTHAELCEITERQRYKSQMKALDAMGIPYKERLNGTVAVDRRAYLKAMGYDAGATYDSSFEPDFEQIAKSTDAP